MSSEKIDLFDVCGLPKDEILKDGSFVILPNMKYHRITKLIITTFERHSTIPKACLYKNAGLIEIYPAIFTLNLSEELPILYFNVENSFEFNVKFGDDKNNTFESVNISIYLKRGREY